MELRAQICLDRNGSTNLMNHQAEHHFVLHASTGYHDDHTQHTHTNIRKGNNVSNKQQHTMEGQRINYHDPLWTAYCFQRGPCYDDCDIVVFSPACCQTMQGNVRFWAIFNNKQQQEQEQEQQREQQQQQQPQRQQQQRL
ncbi:unnamed protein product [Polarella glacialis]|uniref:Uncharacterized protein n=1 Tax=Polarella glacialis TaxID=89957 RepID=A0A813EGL9_POLGL|nr:unnamed protein product [Polarella glacialis]